MKRLLLLTMMALAGGQLLAQETDTLQSPETDILPMECENCRRDNRAVAVEIGPETRVQVTFGDKDELDDEDKKDDRKHDVFDFGIFNGLDIGFNAFMLNGNLNLPPSAENFKQRIGNSTNVQLRFVNVDFRPEDWIWLNFALALDYNDWALENNVTLQPDQEQVTFVEESIDFSKNKFKAKYLALPFNLQFRTSSDITFTGGFEPQFLLRGRVKQRNAEEGKTKVDDNFNLREFRYAWVGRIGYNGFSVFCRYYPKSIFADGEGPDMQNIAFGVGWGL